MVKSVTQWSTISPVYRYGQVYDLCGEKVIDITIPDVGIIWDMLEGVFQEAQRRPDRSNKHVDSNSVSRQGMWCDLGLWIYTRYRSCRKAEITSKMTDFLATVLAEEWYRYQQGGGACRGIDVPIDRIGTKSDLECKSSECPPDKFNFAIYTRPPSGKSSQYNLANPTLDDWEVWLENSFYCGVHIDITSEAISKPLTWLGWATKYELLHEFTTTSNCYALNQKFPTGFPVIGKHWMDTRRPTTMVYGKQI